jgi:glyoxylase-like metal-dependent hydrolase (beta-lactamase superfamily II)
MTAPTDAAGPRGRAARRVGDELRRPRRPWDRQAVIVDPGQHGEEAVPVLLERVGLTAVAILLTHAHLDHLWAAPALARSLGVPVHLHPDDAWLWRRPEEAFGPQGAQLAAGFGFSAWDVDGIDLRPLAHGQRLELAGLRIDVHHTPGHTPGHVVFTTDDLAGAPMRLDERPLNATGARSCCRVTYSSPAPSAARTSPVATLQR